MKKLMIILVIFTFCCLPVAAFGYAILYDWNINVNGALYQESSTYSAPTVGGAITGVTGFSPFSIVVPDTGNTYAGPLASGSITVTFNPGVAGSYNIEGYFDPEIYEPANTYYNETGASVGTPPAGIYGSVGDLAGDINLTMGLNFILAANEYVVLTFNLSSLQPTGFYLSQSDPGLPPDGNYPNGLPAETIYLSSTQAIYGGGQPVPEPATLILLGSGLAGLFGFRKKFRK